MHRGPIFFLVIEIHYGWQRDAADSESDRPGPLQQPRRQYEDSFGAVSVKGRCDAASEIIASRSLFCFLSFLRYSSRDPPTCFLSFTRYSSRARLVLQLRDSVHQLLDCVPCDHLSWFLGQSGRERLIVLELSVHFLDLERTKQSLPLTRLHGRAGICEHSIVCFLGVRACFLESQQITHLVVHVFPQWSLFRFQVSCAKCWSWHISMINATQTQRTRHPFFVVWLSVSSLKQDNSLLPGAAARDAASDGCGAVLQRRLFF